MKLPITLCLLALTCAAQAAKESPVKVTKIAEPERALRFEVSIPAPVGDVWNAFTTSEGLNTWLWSDCTVDLREGGGWTVHYPGGATGGGTILNFTSGKQITLRAMAPEKFPEVRSTGTIAKFEFAADGDKTRVTLTQTGWKQGKEWDDAYEYLSKGNAQLLEQLLYRFVKGPIQWKKQ